MIVLVLCLKRRDHTGPGMVVYSYNPSTQEAEIRRILSLVSAKREREGGEGKVEGERERKREDLVCPFHLASLFSPSFSLPPEDTVRRWAS
jgi:hypothetical protein